MAVLCLFETSFARKHLECFSEAVSQGARRLLSNLSGWRDCSRARQSFGGGGEQYERRSREENGQEPRGFAARIGGSAASRGARVDQQFLFAVK